MAVPASLHHPKLKSGLTRLRRGPTTVQFGLDPDRAVLVSGVDPALDHFLDRLDGAVRPGELARELRIPAARVRRLLAELAAADLLEDAAVTADGWHRLPVGSRDRLAPDLASATLTHPGPDAGKRAMSRRLAAAVEVRGGGRVGATTAALLAAAGVGRVHVVDDAEVRPADLAPGGLRLPDLGLRRGPAATAVAGQFSAVPCTRPAPLALVVLADRLPGLGAADDLVRAGIPHLVAAVRETEGVVGPLVLPLRSSCLHCHHLIRSDRDRAWPHLAAQLAADDDAGPSSRDRPADVVLATFVAAQAALQALCFLDTGHAETVDGTLHLRLPGGVLRRRSWRRHPACGCAWAERTAG